MYSTSSSYMRCCSATRSLCLHLHCRVEREQMRPVGNHFFLSACWRSGTVRTDNAAFPRRTTQNKTNSMQPASSSQNNIAETERKMGLFRRMKRSVPGFAVSTQYSNGRELSIQFPIQYTLRSEPRTIDTSCKTEIWKLSYCSH
jgi:hypothetical protein